MSLRHVNEVLTREIQADDIFRTNENVYQILHFVDVDIPYLEVTIMKYRIETKIISGIEEFSLNIHGNPLALSADDEFNHHPFRIALQ